MALTPETLVPRLGEVLVKEKLLDVGQLDQALERQRLEKSSGNAVQIGQLLIEMGFITRETLDQAVTIQILRLQTALQDSNRLLEKRVKERTLELEVAYKKLSELTQLKANFISNISHELRTPLTHIIGYIDLFLSETSDYLSPELEQGLKVMQRSSDRLMKLIDDLIQFSAAGIGSMQINPKNINLYLVAENAIDRYRSLAKQKHLNLTLVGPENDIVVSADPDRIEWVICQLLDNAVKYTPAEGQVVISLQLDKGNAIISVEDTGIGFKNSQIEEVFEPFHQLDGSSSRTQGGTGIGLTLARRIIEAHGSKIDVLSVPGKGSKFSFHLSISNNLD